MSILGRVGALFRSELSLRLRGRPWAGAGRPGRHDRRRDRPRDQSRTVADQTTSRPQTAAPGPRPARDPALARYYANLELPYGAGVDAIRDARRRLLKRYHPDLHSGDAQRRQTATQLAQGLNRAHDELVGRLDRK